MGAEQLRSQPYSIQKKSLDNSFGMRDQMVQPPCRYPHVFLPLFTLDLKGHTLSRRDRTNQTSQRTDVPLPQVALMRPIEASCLWGGFQEPKSMFHVPNIRIHICSLSGYLDLQLCAPIVGGYVADRATVPIPISQCRLSP